MLTPDTHAVESHGTLERQIEQARLRMLAAQTPEDRRSAWEDMRALIASRSPERVREMEIARGLMECE